MTVLKSSKDDFFVTEDGLNPGASVPGLTVKDYTTLVVHFSYLSGSMS